MTDAFERVRDTGDKLKVFISYSRADLEFADQLYAALETCGYAPVIDRHSIHAAERWQPRLGRLILEADTVAFIVSPDSAVSEICAWEVNEAARLHKRIIPIVCRPLGDVSPPERLRDLNYIYFYPEAKKPESGFGKGLAQLDEALSTNLDWVREHTRLAGLAERWEEKNKSETLLLRGDALAEAEDWLNAMPKSAPEPVERHRAFIQASRAEEDLRQSKEHKRIEEMQLALDTAASAQEDRERAIKDREEEQIQKAAAQRRFSLALVLLLAVGVVAMMAALWQHRQNNLRDAIFLANIANQSSDQGFFDRALRHAIAALPVPGELSPLVETSREAEVELFRAINASRLVAQLKHGRELNSAVLSADGGKALTADKFGNVVVWGTDTGQPIVSFVASHSDGVQASFGAGEDAIYTFDGSNEILEWRARDGVLAKEQFIPGERLIGRSVGSTTFFITTQMTGLAVILRVRRLDQSEPIATFEVATTENTNEVRAVVSNDGQLGAVAENGSSLVRVFGRAAPADGILFDHKRGVSALVFNHSGTRLAVASDTAAYVWDLKSRQQLARLEGHDGKVLDLAFSPDDALIVTASEDKSARVWHLEAGKTVNWLRGHEDYVTAARFSGDGRRVITASRDGTARIWRSESRGSEVAHESDVDVIDMIVTRDGPKLLKSSDDGRQLSVVSPKIPLETVDIQLPAELSKARLSPDGSRVAALLKTTTETETKISFALWHAGNGSQLKMTDLPAETEEGAQIFGLSGEGEVVLLTKPETTTEGDDEGVRVLRLGIGEVAFEFSGYAPRAEDLISSNLMTLVAVRSDELEVWDLAVGKKRGAISGVADGSRLTSISDDGAFAITIDDNRLATVWDLRKLRHVSTLRGHDERILAVAINKDASLIVTGGLDRAIRIWDVETGRQVSRLTGLEHSVESLNFDEFHARIYAMDGTRSLRQWEFSQQSGLASGDVRSVACASKLLGARRFSQSELANAALASRPYMADPCSRPDSLTELIWRITGKVIPPEQRMAFDGRDLDDRNPRDNVSWPLRDARSPDYRHLRSQLTGSTFDFTADDLELLIRANRFSPERANGKVLFALRGAQLVEDDSSESAVGHKLDVDRLRLKDTRPNHKNLQSILGVYDLMSRKLSAFKGETVPSQPHVLRGLQRGGKGVNLMPTGAYNYVVGPHRGKNGCFRQNEPMVVIRSANNGVYEIDDIWDPAGWPFDNIRPSFASPDGLAFSSLGDLIVEGTINVNSGEHRGDWALFRKSAGLMLPRAGDHGKKFDIVLLTGLEAAIAASLRVTGQAGDPSIVQERLGRLRAGSRGADVIRLQKMLGIEETGRFDVATVVALTTRQKEALGYADGILSPEVDARLGFCAFSGNGCTTKVAPVEKVQ